MTIGSLLPMKSMAYSDSLMSSMELLHTGSAFSLRQLAHVGLGYSKFGCHGRFGVPLFLLDAVTSGFSSLPRTFFQPGESILICGAGCTGTVLPVLDLGCVGSTFFVRGMVNLNSLSIHNYGIQCQWVNCDSSLSVRSFKLFGSFFSIWGCARIEGLLFVLDHLQPGLIPLPRSHSKVDPTMLIFDFLHLGFPLVLRNPACVEVPLFSFGFSGLESLVLPQSSAKLGTFLLLFEGARLDMLTLLCDSHSLGTPSALQSFACSESLLSVWDNFASGSILPLQSIVWLGLVLVVSGRGLDSFDSSLFVLDSSISDSLLSLHRLSRCGAFMSFFQLSRIDCMIPAPDFLCLELSLSLRSMSYVEAVVPALDLAKTDSFLLLHTLAQLDTSLLVSGLA